MTLIARALTVGLICGLLGPPSWTSATAETRQPDVVRQDASKVPSLLAVLTLAQALAESGRHESYRLPLRSRVATTIKMTGQESEFGDYVYNSLSFWEIWNPGNNWVEIELIKRNRSIEEDAKSIYLADNLDGARRLLDKRECQPRMIRCVLARQSPDHLLLGWDIESNKLSKAARRARDTDWNPLPAKIGETRRVAQALFDAGKRHEALQLLSEVRADPRLNRIGIAELYWRVGEKDDGRKLMREAIKKLLDEAARDPEKPLPGHHLLTQWAMGDKEGANETLLRLSQFDRPRVGVIKPQIAGLLALAGRDGEAFALVDGGPTDRTVLAYITIAQGRSGDFDSAFTTLDRLQSVSTVQTQDSPTTPGPMTAVVAIARIAARAGNVDVFERADEIRMNINVERLKQRTTLTEGWTWEWKNNPNSPVFKDLARGGNARVALAHALAKAELDDKISAVCMVAEGLAGLPDGTYDPLGFFEYW